MTSTRLNFHLTSTPLLDIKSPLDLRCPQRCCCHPESHIVAFRNRVEVGDDAPILRRPAYLQSHFPKCPLVCCDQEPTKALIDFPVINDCRAACSLDFDLRRFRERLSKGGQKCYPNKCSYQNKY